MITKLRQTLHFEVILQKAFFYKYRCDRSLRSFDHVTNLRSSQTVDIFFRFVVQTVFDDVGIFLQLNITFNRQ